MSSNKEETREEFYARIQTYDDKQDIILVEKKHEYADVYSFIFKPQHQVDFTPGYYAHVVIHDLPKSAGGPVRYLSIASAPSDGVLQFTTHVRDESAHKQKLGKLKIGDFETIYKVKGDFVLPKDQSRSVVLVAGGIGITPFRSMLREEAHNLSSRDITLVHVSDKEYLFEKELREFSFSQFRIKRDEINAYMETLYKEKTNAVFYASGPPGFVDAMKELLEKIGVKKENIKQDWFDNYDDSYV